MAFTVGSCSLIASFTKSMAFELGPHGITVNALGPTVIVTDLNRELVKTQPHLYDAVVKRTAVGRLGEPEVQYWHEVDAGFAGRQPLSPELVG